MIPRGHSSSGLVSGPLSGRSRPLSVAGRASPLLAASIALNVLLLLGALLLTNTKAERLGGARRAGLLEEPAQEDAEQADVRARLERTEGLLQKMETETRTLAVALQTAKSALQAHAAAQDAAAAATLDAAAGAADAAAADAAAAGSAGSGGGVHSAAVSPGEVAKPWLTIGIPTVPRGEGAAVGATGYLTRTLETLLDELPSDPQVLVMNNAAPGQAHPEFEALARRAAAGPPGDAWAAKARAFLTFLHNPGTVTDPAPELPDPDDLHNPGDRPGRQVRKQTCDLIALMRHAAPLSRYYMFMEDDFESCRYSLRAAAYAVTKASSQPHTANWAALRLSYGLNGVVVHAADLPALADFLWRVLLAGRPCAIEAALLSRTWPTGAGMGVLGAVGPCVTDRRLRCLDAVLRSSENSTCSAWSLQISERFQQRCAHVSDLSPCASPLARRAAQSGAGLGAEPWLHAPLQWPSELVDRPAPHGQQQQEQQDPAQAARHGSEEQQLPQQQLPQQHPEAGGGAGGSLEAQLVARLAAAKAQQQQQASAAAGGQPPAGDRGDAELALAAGQQRQQQQQQQAAAGASGGAGSGGAAPGAQHAAARAGAAGSSPAIKEEVVEVKSTSGGDIIALPQRQQQKLDVDALERKRAGLGLWHQYATAAEGGAASGGDRPLIPLPGGGDLAPPDEAAAGAAAVGKAGGGAGSSASTGGAAGDTGALAGLAALQRQQGALAGKEAAVAAALDARI
eukprot:scaffold9.g3012.t1